MRTTLDVLLHDGLPVIASRDATCHEMRDEWL